MAEYTRFEIYIPVVYSSKEYDTSGTEHKADHSLKAEDVEDFIREVTDRFRGVTQANPLGPAPFKGWWKAQAKPNIEIDFLTLLFGLVRIDETESAHELFKKWKLQFESSLKQDVILVLFYPVQTIGDFF